jgi:hypothetical protein
MMLSRRIRVIRLGAFGVVGLGLALIMGASLISQPSSVASALPVSVGGESLESPPSEPPPDLVIHEWGTFLGMSGSDGSSLDGMYHEEHALPAFVHTRSRDQLRLPGSLLKGETPVIYFYTDRPQSVRIGVRFPKGVWTQWYPQAVRVDPSLVQGAESPDRPGNGLICWHADILPTSLVEQRRIMKDGEIPSLPATSAEALWNFARNVDAAYVRCLDGTKTQAAPEYERFLFYRGLGEARLPLRLDAQQGGTLSADQEPTIAEGIRHVFVLRVENGRGAYRYRPLLRPGQTVSSMIPATDRARPLAEFTRDIASDLASRLEASGLHAKEARAMVNTWTTSYFQTEGIRVLCVLPQSWTDAFIPMTVVPKPKQVVRVMVGRGELITPERERQAEAAVRSLADPDGPRRLQAFAYLREQGRYVEPIIRRVQRTTNDANVRVLCRRLLLTDFVTELRAAIHSASDGTLLGIDPMLLRAHLARLLRDIGLDKEARSEGTAILNELERIGSSPDAGPANQSMIQLLRDIRAAALEASGIDRSAAVVYADRIESQLRAWGRFDAPIVAWFREWWVGRGYGRSVVRAGKSEQTIAELQARLASGSLDPSGPERRLSCLLLAYIHEARGEQQLAEGSWDRLLASDSQAKAAPTETKVVERSGSE